MLSNPMMEAVEAPGSAAASAGAAPRAVLVTDPNPASRELMLRRLQTLGYATLQAADGAQTLALWRSGGAGMVITDSQLTDMDAYALARAIRAGDSGNVAIVASWPHAFLRDLEACYEAGIDDHLPQPASMAALARLMAQWLPLPVAGEATLDPARLNALAGGSTPVAESLLQDFAASNAADRRALQRAFALRDLAAIGRIAHAVRGAAQAIGAARLARAASVLEAAWRRSDLPSALAGQPDFDRACTGLDDYLALRLSASA
ncbi:response regulator [Pseudoduganella sp. DS3]|uniref:Response regulator n=1 Tax=Pseudoduganella guangdongensis TaxID=2692179 RepID=A0A6N9HPM6_9BURK|nr:response regulator [Pseudoduganella guangdongensis]MYN05173.1 response regulator [Pseudoduganella guangdongensis]